MTKPIEGWVAWHPTLDSARWQEAKDSLVGITVCMSPEACGDFKDAPDWCARPVRITFTDEPDVMQKRLEGETPSREVSRNDPNCCAESSTHEAVRKALKEERERIYNKLADCDWDTWEELAVDEKLRAFIFGEEK